MIRIDSFHCPACDSIFEWLEDRHCYKLGVVEIEQHSLVVLQSLRRHPLLEGMEDEAPDCISPQPVGDWGHQVPCPQPANLAGSKISHKPEEQHQCSLGHVQLLHLGCHAAH